jgi:hypothetical protein
MDNNNKIDDFISKFEKHLDLLKKGSEIYFNKWIEDVKNFNNPAPEINNNYQGYMLQTKRYDIMIKIAKCTNITQNEFDFLIKQEIIKTFFEENSILYNNLLINEYIIQVYKKIKSEYFDFLIEHQVDNLFDAGSMFYNNDYFTLNNLIN